MSSIDINRWKSFNLRQPDQVSKFQNELPQYLTEALSTSNLAQVLNGNGGKALPGSAVNTKQATLTAVSTNQTVDCTGALHVAVIMTFTAALTLTLTNLQIGASVMLDVNNTSASAKTLTIAATAPGNVAYVVIKANVGTQNKNWLAGASVGITTEFIMNGQTTPGPNLVMSGN